TVASETESVSFKGGDSGTYTIWVTAVVGGSETGQQYTRELVFSAAPAKPTTIIKTAFGGRTVQLNCADEDAEIYYSFGSSKITTDCAHVKAGGTIFLNEPMTGNKAAMFFKSYKDGKWSVLGKWGVLNVQIAKPIITQSGKKTENKFKIYTQTKDSYIVYTLNGTIPSIEEGTQKLKVKNGRIIWGTSDIIEVPKGKTIKAIAIRNGLVTSDIMEYTNK
ncbi:MAG: chitobiase/beta-hexosaminidase C-terminal domain-containing protein, partial [Oscillospiraceae bacterium]|nr:chitobiase/beta-hexosaminidase C-terminal domain-containing protein [Oscillospiraceae bacterium]